MRKCGRISSRAADAVIVSGRNSWDRTTRNTAPSLQTLLLGRLLGPVGVYGGASTTRGHDGRACTCSLLRPSALRMLVAWGRASQTPESTHDAYPRRAVGMAVLRPPRSSALARAARALREGSRLDERRPPCAPLSATGERRRRNRRRPSGSGSGRVSPRPVFLAAGTPASRRRR